MLWENLKSSVLHARCCWVRGLWFTFQDKIPYLQPECPSLKEEEERGVGISFFTSLYDFHSILHTYSDIGTIQGKERTDNCMVPNQTKPRMVKNNCVMSTYDYDGLQLRAYGNKMVCYGSDGAKTFPLKLSLFSPLFRRRGENI